ncbi:MAG: glycosyltransferase, partial [Dehalococcoidia bacterium]|nr:glycosyltransferase [Dehalococcoidia bacterium]
MSLLYRQPIARSITLITGAYLLYYLWWRATSTLNVDVLWFSLALFLAEAQGILNFFLFAFMVWDVDCRPPFRLRSGLTVDVFVPTYNESIDILEATLTGCNAMTYPHTTYVLDDGRRPEVARLAEELGVQYLTRPDNRHAKAGNLNAALEKTRGEFIVVLDADTVPQPDLLEKTLGYFVDPKVALVQLPQEF